MAFSGGDGGRSGMSEINVTPLVDVMLVLLIIFMVAAPMMTTALPVDLPKTKAERVEIEQDTPLVTIGEDQRVFLGKEEVGLEGLRAAVEAHEGARKENKVFVQADEAVAYGFVMKAFTQIREAGIDNLALVTDPAGGATEKGGGRD
jgi:biopolymer transport protein TolR